MHRWILQSGGPFASFLHSSFVRAASSIAATAFHIWPMPIPFRQEHSYKEETFDQPAGATTSHHQVRCRRKAVNLLVALLNWLHLRKVPTCPESCRIGVTLNRLQRATVRRLSFFFEELEVCGIVSPQDMGRTASKVEGLEEIAMDLERLARELGLCTPAPGEYGHRTAGTGAVRPPLAPGATSADSGVVVGKLRRGLPVLAKDVDASRLSFPQDRPKFKASEVLKGIQREVYNSPLQWAQDPDSSTCPVPRAHVQASRRGALKLLEFLDAHHRLELLPEAEIRRSHLCGAFSLLKDQTRDRLILDARPANILEEPALNDYTQTLGAVQALLQVELLPDQQMIFHGDDLRDYYYCFCVTKERVNRNCMRFPLAPRDVAHLSCFSEKLLEHKTVYPCLATMAMGDLNAVEFGQAAHVLLALDCRATSLEELLTVRGRAPRGNLATGIIIDDYVVCEKVAAPPGDLPTEGETRMAWMNEAYAKVELTAHTGKAFRRESQAEFWGAAADGNKGTVRPSPKRLIPLIMMTVRVARLQIATVGLLEILAGSWVAIFQFRKRLMCLLEEIYAAQRGREQNCIVHLSCSMIHELWSLVLVAPLAVTNLRAKTLPVAYLTDASEQMVAGVSSRVPEIFARELHRHCLARGVWTRMLTPWKVWLRRHDLLQPEEELPAGVPLVSHPVWTSLARCLSFKLLFRSPVRRRRHINLLELQAVLEVERRAALRKPSSRLLIGVDSQVVLGALLKGRTASPPLNRMLQYSLPTLLGGDLYSSYGYVPSLANVADDPTRGASIRSPAAEPPDWLVNAFQGDFDSLDKWLNALGFGPQQLACLPGCPKSLDAGMLEDFVRELRSVQKPDRLARFDQAVKTPDPFVSPPCKATRKPLAPQEPIRGSCSPPAGTEEPQEFDSSCPVGDPCGPGQSCDNEAQDGRPLRAAAEKESVKRAASSNGGDVKTPGASGPRWCWVRNHRPFGPP